MLLGKSEDFFRQNEKNVGFLKSFDGGDGGLHESKSVGMPLLGMRPTVIPCERAYTDFRAKIKLFS